MNYDETLKYIHSLGKFKLPPTLDRIKEVCGYLGNPQDALKFIHIAGTNGKGSTATMTANILKESGLKVGLYISPYIIDFRERIQINNEYIPEKELAKHSETVLDTNTELNEFEFITAVAFLYFAEQRCDVVVLETGLGGRLDPTNVIKNPLCSVITKIGLDHTAILGDTIEKITKEKCGIIKNGNVVTIPNQDENALGVIKKFSGDLTVPEMPEILSSDLTGSRFVFENREYFVSLLGVHQAYNAVTAIKTVEKSGFKVTKDDVDTALKNTVFPARLEIVSKNPLTIIDGAHNPDGAKVLSGFLRETKENITLIVAMMRDKNCDGFLREVLPNVSKVMVTTIDNPRCISADDLLVLARKYNGNSVKVNDLADALNLAKAGKNPVFIVGSLYLASEARKFYK